MKFLSLLRAKFHRFRKQSIPRAFRGIMLIWPAVSMMLAWGLITWSMFGWNRRAWAASVGTYLILSSVLKLVETYTKSKVDAANRRIDR